LPPLQFIRILSQRILYRGEIKKPLAKKTIKLLELAEEERRLQRSIKEEQILKQVQDRF